MATKKKIASESSVVSAAQKAEVANSEKVTANAKAMVAAGPDFLRKLTDTKLELSAAIDLIGTTLAERFKHLAECEEAIKLQQEFLQSTYGIQADADTLERLRAEIDAQRKAWEEEKAETEKQRLREEEEYEYKQTQLRKHANTEWEAFKRAREEKLIAREAEVKAKELELVEWKKKVDAVPAEIAAQAAKEVAIATNALKSKLEADHRMAMKDQEMALALARQTLDAQAKQLANLEAQLIEARKAQLEAANRVQEIAAKAIDGASKQTVVVPTMNSSEPTRK